MSERSLRFSLTCGAGLLIGSLVVTGCGGQQVLLDGEATEVRVITDPVSLELVEWQLIELRQDARVRDVAEIDAVLRFDGEGGFSGRGCNFFGGEVETAGGRLRAKNSGSTEMGCSDVRGEIDNVTQAVLTGGAAWTIRDGQLRISGDGVELVYRPRDVLFPNRDATALVEGERGEAVWRLSWQTTGDQVGVDWESRERPGTGFEFTGIARPVDFDVTYLEPSFTSVAGEAFVFVVVPRGTDRVEFRPPGGREPVDLSEYVVPPAKTWSLFAGFVGPQSKGGVLVSFDADGEQLMESYALPG